MHFLERLREANKARDAQWANKDRPFTVVFWANELAGEAGEACNILKKFDREFLYHVPGSRAVMPALAEEFADIIICADLLAICTGLDFDTECWKPVVEQTGFARSDMEYSRIGLSIAASVGHVCSHIETCMLNHLPVSTRSRFATYMHSVIDTTTDAAHMLGIDLEQAVTSKFNMTSEKIGLRARL